MIELENIDGIGPKTKELLNKLKIYNGDDLLYYYPYRYDVLKRSDISVLNDGDKIVMDGIIEGQPTIIYVNKSLKKIIFRINTGHVIFNVTLYNRVHLYSELKSGKEVTIIGKYNKLKNTVGNIRKRNNRLTFIPDSDTITHTIKITNMKDFPLVDGHKVIVKLFYHRIFPLSTDCICLPDKTKKSPAG